MTGFHSHLSGAGPSSHTEWWARCTCAPSSGRTRSPRCGSGCSPGAAVAKPGPRWSAANHSDQFNASVRVKLLNTSIKSCCFSLLLSCWLTGPDCCIVCLSGVSQFAINKVHPPIYFSGVHLPEHVAALTSEPVYAWAVKSLDTLPDAFSLSLVLSKLFKIAVICSRGIHLKKL